MELIEPTKINNGNEKVFYRSSGYGIFGRM